MDMEKKYLVVNIGSASKKYGLYGAGQLLSVHMEKGADLICTIKTAAGSEDFSAKADDYDNASAFIVEQAKKRGFITGPGDITAIGMRIVAPGMYFQENRLISDDYRAKLELAREMAPLHINPVLAELDAIKTWSDATPLYGISDSAFYKDMPVEAKFYGLPEDIATQYQVYRYGYHGISMRSIVGKLEKMGSMPPRLIICHLGSGSTVTALHDGQPIDTSMGFTPLEGVPMGSRVGNIDAGAVIFLAKKLGGSLDELETILNTRSGLLGISGKTQFVKDLIDLEKSGDVAAGRALAIFGRAVKKYIGAYMALLGGLDMLVFTATIGERSDILRDRICSDLESLNIHFDPVKNNATIDGDGFIEKDGNQLKIAVLGTDEMGEMARSLGDFQPV